MAIDCCSQCAWERKYARALPVGQRVCRLHASMNARDADWIARNLGDVPYRHTGGLWELVVAVGIDGPLPSSACTPGCNMYGELVRSTDGTLGRLGAGVTLRD